MPENRQNRTRKKKRKPWKVIFLNVLSVTGNVFQSCKAAKMVRSVVYKERADNADFKKDWDNALEQAADILEFEARRRAYEGLVRKKFTGKGEAVIDPATGKQYIEREYSDTLLIFLLKGINPEKFRERVSAEHSGPGGKPIEVADEQRCARFLELLEQARARGIATDIGGDRSEAPTVDPAAGTANDGDGEQG